MANFRRKAGELLDRVADRLRARMAADDVAAETVRWVLQAETADGFAFPAQYLELLREWLAPRRCKVTELLPAPARSRYGALLGSLAANLPVPPIAFAREAGRAADRFLADFTPLEFGDYLGDVAHQFELSSSFASKGRILYAAVRFLRPKRYLELGTAYGMSALFVGRSQGLFVDGAQAVTVEKEQIPHAAASKMLAEAGVQIECRRQSAQDALRDLCVKRRHFDLVFHDAAHDFESYVEDFRFAESLMPRGAVLLLDDIHWSDPRFFSGEANAYEGWRQIVASPRVVAAAEIDDAIGIALLD